MISLDAKKGDFEKVLEHLHVELGKLRTGRANPAMLEDVKVDYYGTPTPLKQIGSIGTPEPRQLVVTPWDKTALASIEKAIREAGLGLNPSNEGDRIRVSIPDLTEERRRELTKVAGRLAEEARIKLRNLREEIVKDLKREEDAGQIPKDEKFRFQDKLQELVNDYNEKIKEVLVHKEQDIMTI